MSLSSAFTKETLERLGELEKDDFVAMASAVTLGYNPGMFYEAVQNFKHGIDPALPHASGQPKPLTVNAWSFVNDRAQFHGVYGLSTAEAAELKDLLMSNREEALSRIESIVSQQLQRKGSRKGVAVSLTGMPGSRAGPGGVEPNPISRELKIEIDSDGSRYGRYKFEATATPFDGPHAFTVPLGGGFNAYFSNKRGAVDVARIARVRTRFFPLIAGYVGFNVPGAPAPLFGDAIPAKANWDCVLGPNEPLPPPPASKATTAAP